MQSDYTINTLITILILTLTTSHTCLVLYLVVCTSALVICNINDIHDNYYTRLSKFNSSYNDTQLHTVTSTYLTQ